ncbi:hypothetical protein A9498_10060 [Bacillus thuringiensis serovar coreanensis]|nr:hypothetical protein A9498_10060 [Bacillus thuringiensis serovar coreanensis]
MTIYFGDNRKTSFSFLEQEIELRKACFYEAIVRRTYLKHPNWIKELGWSEEDEKRFYKVTTVCDILKYKKPNTPSCHGLQINVKPLAPLKEDNTLFQALARLELANRFPEREPELFNWKRNSISKKEYWKKCVGDLHELDLLYDNSDFKLNIIIRLLYLYGALPQNLSAPWLDKCRLVWDGIRWVVPVATNFDVDVQEQIQDALLRFKYWHDESFRVLDETEIHKARRDRNVLEKKLSNREKSARGEKTDEITDSDRDENNQQYKYEMQYWSENHQILFATAEYLAGQLMQDKIFRPGERHRSRQGYHDMTGAERMERAKARINVWLNDRLRFGLSEFNAPGYYDEHFLALLNLADFALDESIQVRASMVLDLMIFDLARFTHKGSFSVAASRAHFKHKNCGWHQSPADLIEILFGTHNGVYVEEDNLSACAFASTRRYSVPEALLRIGRDQPASMIDRSRVSINFNEAAEYGIGFENEIDIMRWWSRASWFTKQLIENTRKVVYKYGLEETDPFKNILPKTGAVAEILTGAKLTTYVALGPLSPFFIGLIGSPFNQEDKVANAMSIITEGSAYTRANIYTYRNSDAMLSSIQNFHSGQMSFQGNTCQATLNMCATVFTSHPSAGGGISSSTMGTIGAIGGGMVGGLLGFAIGGPVGAAIGAGAGASVGEKILEHTDITLLPSNDDGPDWWTGSVTQPRAVQLKNAVILAYNPKDFQLDLFGHRFHAYFPQDAFDNLPLGIKGQPPDSVDARKARSEKYFPFREPLGYCNIDTGRWVFGRVNKGYIALFSAQMPVWTHDGDWACKEIVVEAKRNIFIIQIGNEDEFGSYESFVDRVLHARIHINGLNWSPADFECSYDIPFGSRLELHYDDNQVRYAGTQFSDDEFPRIENPYARICWQQNKYVIQHQGHSLIHDVKKCKRITTSRTISELDHDANLRIFYQKMDLNKPYKGTERYQVIEKLIEVLRTEQFDIVGLSEVWEGNERIKILDELSDIYKFHFEDEISSIGGLLLLSRHKITKTDVLLYQQCDGDDCLWLKGALYTQIQVNGHPCALDIFLTQTQNLSENAGEQEFTEHVLKEQIHQLYTFINSCRNHSFPAFLMGDLNWDSSADYDFGEYLYNALYYNEDLMPTFKLVENEITQIRPSGTSEDESTHISSFYFGNDPRPINDAQRFGIKAKRLDYLLSWNGLLFEPRYTDCNVVIFQSSDGRDISDHYGIQTRLEIIKEKIPSLTQKISSVTARMTSFRCLRTTSGPAEEVEFSLHGVTSAGKEQEVTSQRFEDVSMGTQKSIESSILQFSDPGDFLYLAVRGKEIDDFSPNANLESIGVFIQRNELIAMLNTTMRRVLPRLSSEGDNMKLRLK